LNLTGIRPSQSRSDAHQLAQSETQGIHQVWSMDILVDCKWEYNTLRPHSSIGYLTLVEYSKTILLTRKLF